MKRVFTFLLAAVTSVVTLAGCSGQASSSAAASSQASSSQASSATQTASSAAPTGEKIKIGYDIYFLGNSWSVQLYEEFKWNAENKYKDQIDVTYVQSDNDVSKQIANIEDLIAQQVDVIITTPCDTTALNSTLQEARDAGIKVILLCATIDGDNYDSLVTVDETDFGATGAKWLAEQLGGKGNIIMLNGISGYSTNEMRSKGAMSVLEQYPDIKILAAEDANWDYAAAKTVTADLLATYPQIDGVWSQGGAMTLGAIEAFQAANRPLVPMTGEDNNGYLKVCVKNNMEGIAVAKPTWLARVAIDNALAMMKGETVKKDDIYPVQTIATAEMPKFVHEALSDDVWCGTEMPKDVLSVVFSN